MTRQMSNNPSGRYLSMTDEQVARADAAFQRAVQRQADRDAAAGARYRADTFRVPAGAAVTKTGNTTYAEASDLRLPGYPSRIVLDGKVFTKVSTARDAEGEVLAVTYKSGALILRVLND